MQKNHQAIDKRGYERRLKLLKAVYDHDLLDSWQLQVLDGGSQQKVLRILNALSGAPKDDPLLIRPAGQRPRYRDGNNHTIYSMGNKGADVLRQEFGIKRYKPSGERIDFSNKYHMVRDFHFQHAILTNNLRVLLARDCTESSRVKYMGEKALFRILSRTWKTWHVPVIHRGQEIELGVTPDHIFRLIFLDEYSPTNFANFFYEADCGTETIQTDKPRPVYIYRKMVAYYFTYMLGLHTKLWGFQTFRVPIVTTCKERIDNMLDANKMFNNGRGSELFLFTTRDEIRACKNILKLVWINGRGEKLTLCD
jgi:Replication-relaxation